MAARSDVKEAMEAGYALKIIWEHMREIGCIPFRYETFLKYVRQHITKARPGSMSQTSARFDGSYEAKTTP